jgi:Ni/Fe-hydrogenase 1 B-type cytochrome subunit
MVAYPIVDRIGIAIFIASVGVIFFHFMGNILTGRIRKRFIEGNFRPVTEDEYILPPIRLMHWVHMVAIAALTFTGMCLRYDWFKPQHTQMKIHHYCFMIIILINLIARITYAFHGSTKTYKDFSFGKKDILNTPAVLRYYLFLKNDYPHIAKYASLQKLSYNLFWMVLIIQGATGFMILWPNALLGWLAPSFGSVKMAEQLFKAAHAGIMWFFLIFTNIHAYIASMEGWPLLMLIFFNQEPKSIEAVHE